MNLPGTYERCMSGHYYAVVRGDEECPACKREADSLKTMQSYYVQVEQLQQENARLRGALERICGFKSASGEQYKATEIYRIAKQATDAKEPAKTRNSETLRDFARFCAENPTHRFWQALRNWSGIPFILACDDPSGGATMDTFNWEGKGPGAA